MLSNSQKWASRVLVSAAAAAAAAAGSGQQQHQQNFWLGHLDLVGPTPSANLLTP